MDGRKRPELRWRPRPKRIRRQCTVTGLAGLDIPLLLLQLPTSYEGTQLPAECPELRPRSRQPSAESRRPTVGQGTDGKNHQVRTDSLAPRDGDRLSVVLLFAHPPSRRTPTAESLPALHCAAQGWPAGRLGIRDHRARGYEATQKTAPGRRDTRPWKLAPSSSGILHIPDDFAKSKSNSTKTPRAAARPELSRIRPSDFDFKKNLPPRRWARKQGLGDAQRR
jgi:hypothetical protein